MTSDYLDQVEAFHKRMKYRTPTPTEPDLSRELIVARTGYLAETFREYNEAVTACDRVEILDALVDMQYILSGTILACGIRSLFVYNFQPPSANMAEAEYYAARIATTIDNMAMVLSLTAEELAVMCYDVQDAIRELSHAHGFSKAFNAAFAVVHENNLQKVWSEIQVGAYSCMPHDHPPYTFDKTDGGYIARDHTGKIKKPIGHKKVDLSEFVQ